MHRSKLRTRIAIRLVRSLRRRGSAECRHKHVDRASEDHLYFVNCSANQSLVLEQLSAGIYGCFWYGDLPDLMHQAGGSRSRKYWVR